MTEFLSKLEPPPRVIKSRTRQRKHMQIIAIHEQEVLTEAGELMTLDQLTAQLPDMPSTIFATSDSLTLLLHFDQIFSVSHPVTWQWRTSNDYLLSSVVSGVSQRKRKIKSAIAVSYFGFKIHNPAFHKLIDPITMFKPPVKERLAKSLLGDGETLVRLWHWAIALRDFCHKNNLEVRPTMGAISTQFLTDARFYPEPRRKVPAFINATGRDHLPGNHYHLTVDVSPEHTYNAYVVDQHRSHHYHAERIRFPHADHIHAYGFHRTLEKYYRNHTNPDFMGLYCLDLQAPSHPRVFTWLGRGTLKRQFVFTNELPHLLDLGYTVLGVYAAWGSIRRETGLNSYAVWAQEQLDQYSEPWMKPLLLSLYGNLACRRSYGEAVFRLASRGEPKQIMIPRGTLTGKLTKRPKALEPQTVSAIQLGMIHAAVRSESVGFAQWITSQGYRVLHIFVDGVFVEADDDRPLPEILPEPWRVKQELTHYQPLHAQGYTSDQETKNPGVRVDHHDRRMVVVRPPHMTHRVAPLQ